MRGHPCPATPKFHETSLFWLSDRESEIKDSLQNKNVICFTDKHLQLLSSKLSWAVRLQESLIINISERGQLISPNSLHIVFMQRKDKSEPNF